MENFSVNPVSGLSYLEIYEILESQKLTSRQKISFLKEHSIDIKDVMKHEITKTEFLVMMKNRPLKRFRPLKNSFTKRGDRILLAEALGIQARDINKYINEIINTNFDIQHGLTKSNIEKVKTYVYRHGTKEQVIAFLEYELSDVKTTLEKLYKTLEYNSGGLCDYFSRPIHRMSNITLGKLYNTIDKSLRASAAAGYMTEEECNSHSQWALIRIYEIQNNSKLIRAYNAYQDLLSG